MTYRKGMLLLLVLLSCGRQEVPPPDVLLITLDTFRADRIGAGTPNLSRLAKDGVRFERAVSPVPLTLPAHASILSGLLPIHHGLRNNGAGVFPQDRETLATAFSRAGYRTGAFVGAFVLDRRFGLNRGFDVYDDEIERDPNKTKTNEASRKAELVVDRALSWLTSSDEARPTFTWVHLWDAHAPYDPPKPYPSGYDGEIAYVDAQVGRILQKVNRSNTVIAVIGDHGEALGEHGERTHGMLLYEPTLRVPLIVAAPGVRPRVISAAVNAVDLAPTLAALSGIEVPVIHGRDLSKNLLAGTDPPPVETYAETQYPLLFGWSELSSLRLSNTKLIDGPDPELYDLVHDPKESRNLIAERRRTYHQLSSSLQSLRSTQLVVISPIDEETKAKLASLGYVASTLPKSSSRGDPKSRVALFREYESLMEQGTFEDPQRAISVLEKLVINDPSNPVFRSSLARVLREEGESRRASEAYREVVAMTPSDPDAWKNLGVMLLESATLTEALSVLNEAVKLNPSDGDALNALGVALARSGKSAEAIAAFQRATTIDPRNEQAWNGLGNAMRETGRAGEAAEAYRKSIQIAPRYADPLNGLGVVLIQQGQPREAIQFFDRAIALLPNFYEAQLNRAIALQEAGDRQAAAVAYRQFLSRLPPDNTFDPQRSAARKLLEAVGGS